MCRNCKRHIGIVESKDWYAFDLGERVCATHSFDELKKGNKRRKISSIPSMQDSPNTEEL